MKIVTGALFLTLAVFLNSIELSSQASKPKTIPTLSPFRFYEAGNRQLYPLKGQILLAVEGGFIVGVVEKDLVRAGYDSNRKRIIFRMKDKKILPADSSSVDDKAIGHPPHSTIPGLVPGL